MHAAILRHLDSLGYATSIHRMGDYVELHAVPLPAGEPLYIARVDGDSGDDVYRAACELAALCGVDLEG